MKDKVIPLEVVDVGCKHFVQRAAQVALPVVWPSGVIQGYL